MICEQYNFIKPIVQQPQYNLLVRVRVEKEYVRLFDEYNCLVIICWRNFTGKYNNGIPKAECRAKTFSDYLDIQEKIQRNFDEANKAKQTSILQKFDEIAQTLGWQQALLAMVWVLNNKDVSSSITSASPTKQLEDTVLAIGFISKITDVIEKEINKLFGTQPNQEINYRTFQLGASRG